MSTTTSLGRVQRYALVLWGGIELGKRPRTALAQLDAVRPGGTYVGRVDGCKSRRDFSKQSVLMIWRGRPSDKQIAAVRRSLAPLSVLEGAECLVTAVNAAPAGGRCGLHFFATDGRQWNGRGYWNEHLLQREAA